MGRELVAADIQLLKAGTCPNCLSTGVYEGPGGGVSANIICYVCWARYRHGPDGLSVIHEPEVPEEKEAGISKERATELEQAKLDRDAVFGKHKMAEMALERDEKAFATLTAELDAARMKIHDLESASWADSVRGEAAWRERALVGEKALEAKNGEVVAFRTCVHRLLDEMTPVDSTAIRGDSQKDVILEAQALLKEDGPGTMEADIVRASLGLLAGVPGSCEAWFAAVKRMLGTE